MGLPKLTVITVIGLLSTFALTNFLDQLFGRSGALVSILTYPLYALVAWPLIRRLGETFLRGIQSAALKDVHGSYYAYQGTPVRVIEDDDQCRWVPMATVRKIMGTQIQDSTFASRYPNGWRQFGGKWHIREDALYLFLSEGSALETVKFKNWVQKSLVNPAQKIRSQKGIVLGPPTAS